MRYKHHLCLVSDQPPPNITPALDRNFRPEQVIMMYEPDMQQRAEQLKAALKPSGIDVREWPVDNGWDTAHIKDRVLSLLSEYDGDIALNTSGGTRPMSIAAHEVFTAFDHPSFYVHAERDRVVWLYPSSHAAFDIEDRIRLPQFLQAHGVSVQPVNRAPVSQLWRNLTQKLVHDIDQFSKPLGTLNYLASNAEERLQVAFPRNKEDWTALMDLIQLFEDAELLELKRGYLTFPNEGSRFFVNSGWLEHYVFAAVQHLRGDRLPHIHDVVQGLNVCRGEYHQAVHNELDVAFLHDNALHLIECKTGQFRQGGANTLYKLDALSDMLGGLRARPMLISYQPISQADKRRAEKDHIQLCIGSQIQQIETVISQWVRAN